MNLCLHEKFRKCIKGLQTSSDCKFYHDLFKKEISCNIDKHIIDSLYTKDDDQMLTYDELLNVIKKIQSSTFRHDTKPILDKLTKKKFPEGFRRCIMKEIQKKTIQLDYLSSTQEHTSFLKKKECPHCSIEYELPDTVTYIICGYDINGFDWIGCGRDWCFRCGKKLCKKWKINQLFNQKNRLHNDSCCIKKANIKKENSNNYCSCSSIDVMHKV